MPREAPRGLALAGCPEARRGPRHPGGYMRRRVPARGTHTPPPTTAMERRTLLVLLLVCSCALAAVEASPFRGDYGGWNRPRPFPRPRPQPGPSFPSPGCICVTQPCPCDNFGGRRG
ncbi:arasin 2-like isoform X3 [Eriocheir sinensis]|uniref:arasin 2-like isoform X1 n=1 Tax=Eriocheir sinensis TaxID=95602 RepID=UPI0021C5FB9E|nr:arasin 2-like isoform X1 [Eriocheir sinensis]XP_050691880.1 arasin 2-like isoform X2 [Eriocheir sinensis]XP_050691881.1 arasin 2-like isoform X3 [Eriocheir sinensis]